MIPEKSIIYCVTFLFIFSCLCIILAVSSFNAHNFEGKCLMCHETIPDKNTKTQNLTFVDGIDKLCSRCHTIDLQKSHPIKVKPDKNIPLMQHLDKDGLLTCTTCHDVHKEDKTANKSEPAGLLWGHIKGRAFCSLCHNKEALDTAWRHQTAIPFAHSSGKLMEVSDGALLDKFSIECLSCHDGTISKFPKVEIKQGVWRHGIGMSHPVGIDYPRSDDFTYIESLPREIELFDGKVGCLSCHQIYNNAPYMLTMDNKGSRLCLSCHRK